MLVDSCPSPVREWGIARCDAIAVSVVPVKVHPAGVELGFRVTFLDQDDALREQDELKRLQRQQAGDDQDLSVEAQWGDGIVFGGVTERSSHDGHARRVLQLLRGQSVGAVWSLTYWMPEVRLIEPLTLSAQWMRRGIAPGYVVLRARDLEAAWA